MKKRRYTIRMTDNEAAVVAPLEFWGQLDEHFRETAKEFPEYADGWIEAQKHVNFWVEKTKSRRPEGDDANAYK